MNTAYLIMLILLLLYIPLWVWVWRNPEKAEKFHLEKYGPAIMIKTHLGIKTMDKVAKYHRLWRVFGFLSKVTAAVLFFLMMYMLVVAIVAIPGRVGQPALGIEYALAIPGFNPILPLSYGIVALFIAMEVHEMGHGIQTRTNGCKVDSTGLLHAVVPLGAFVQPNEEEMSKQPRRVQMDMYTAGITVNTIMAVLCMGLLVFSCGYVTTDYGDDAGVFAVDQESPAYYADLPASAIIVSVETMAGEKLPFEAFYDGSFVCLECFDDEGTSMLDPSQFYRVTYDYHGELTTVDKFQIGVFIKTITKGSPADNAGIKPGEMLYSMDFRDDGKDPYVITSVNAFLTLMKNSRGGDVVDIVTMSVFDGKTEVMKTAHSGIVLTDRNGKGFLGVSTNTSGMALTTPNMMLDRATDPFAAANGSPMSYVQSLFGYLSGPFNGMDPVPDDIKWWYDTPGDGLFWTFVTLLYWVFWLDLLLAISNALPAYPFDGGFIFAGGINWLLEKFGVKDEERRQTLTDSVASSVSTVTLFAFILVILSLLI